MGLFITFEGVEGSGKSTQMELLRSWLAGRGRDVVTLREPGGTLLGEKVRTILTNSADEPIDPWAELFLFEACRAQLVKNVIRPALERGSTVVCDRFTDSTVAYQGYGRGLDIGAISEANRLASSGLVPDITFLLDCPPEAGLKRALERIGAVGGSREDRFEREDLSFHDRVREGYLRLARKEPGRIRVVDGTRDIPSIHGDICDIMEKASKG